MEKILRCFALKEEKNLRCCVYETHLPLKHLFLVFPDFPTSAHCTPAGIASSLFPALVRGIDSPWSGSLASSKSLFTFYSQ
jgi:hypothetical protein